MAIRCLLTTSLPDAGEGSGISSYRFVLASLDAASGERVRLVEHPDEADVILFAEPHVNEGMPDDVARVLASPLYRSHRAKVVIHSGKDDPRPLIPGLYPSIPARWARVLGCQGAPYLQPNNPYLADLTMTAQPSQLASFVGASAGKPVRLRLLEEAGASGWGDIVVRDTHADYTKSALSGDAATHDRLKQQFVSDLLAAKFALCPAGAGPSSFRIFESMQAGRAPVIIADAWSPPPGPDWPSFSIRVAERDIPHLPALLREREAEWPALGEAARQAWERFYSPATIGETVVGQAHAIVLAGRATPVARRLYVHAVRTPRRAVRKVTAKLRRLAGAQ